MSKNMVYIIDDQIGIRLLLKEIIQSEGFTVKEFETGHGALENCLTDQPCLLFVDYKLPIINGVEIIKRLNQKLNKQIPVVLMSGYSVDEMDKDDEININEILLKPFDVTNIITILHKYIG